jgi:hypothetical protein
LRTEEEQSEQISPATGVPVLGLDALASASYGPEAALTILLPLGGAAAHHMGPIIGCIIVVLLAAFFSYRQTIAAYPNGGGSYTVARENLGSLAGLLAASALSIDYVLNVAVAISASVGALVSAVPSLWPLTLPMCLGILALFAAINLRGIRSAGLCFMAPTYLFVASPGLLQRHRGAHRAFSRVACGIPRRNRPTHSLVRGWGVSRFHVVSSWDGRALTPDPCAPLTAFARLKRNWGCSNRVDAGHHRCIEIPRRSLDYSPGHTSPYSVVHAHQALPPEARKRV